MPTNNIKHKMLQLAKEIAARNYVDRVEKVRNLATLKWEDYITPASLVRSQEIQSILDNHPEFNPSEFKKMIRDFQIRNAEKEEQNG